MTASEKITILLADEDALRRDGLAAVLQGTAKHEIVAQCGDGEQALERIRALRPDVAVIDLNLPRVHGIELVRKVRSEALSTKIVILSGTDNEEIVREVVRAGGDGYLLKNGPARHLLDAISYVRDGGQYFSPQMGRDGRDRHLLEEPPRPAAAAAAQSPVADAPAGETDATRLSRGPRYGKARRGTRRGGDSRLKDSLFDQAAGENLEDRDYEILDMMAEGIRPILDRLDEIDSRVGQMETGAEPVPKNVRGWLNTQLADSLQGAGGRDVTPQRTVNDLESKLPRMIEEAVTARFHQMAGKLQQEIEETHVRTLESFVKNVQVKLVQRVSALETDMSRQAEAMLQLRDYSQRTEDNLGRLIAGVDKLAQELPKRLTAGQSAANPQNAETETGTFEALAQDGKPADASPQTTKLKRRRADSRRSVKLFWAVVAVVLIVAGAGVAWKSRTDSAAASQTPVAQTGATAGSAKPGGTVAPPSASADTKTKLQAAGDYTDRKDYAMAEDIYRQLLKASPNDTEVMKLLASVLYREDKIDESAAILDRLPKDVAPGTGKVADIPPPAK